MISGDIKNVISGIEWLLKNKDKYTIRIVNISVGSVCLKKFDDDISLIKEIQGELNYKYIFKRFLVIDKEFINLVYEKILDGLKIKGENKTIK